MMKRMQGKIKQKARMFAQIDSILSCMQDPQAVVVDSFKRVRKAYGLSCAELGEILGLNRSTVSNIENRRQKCMAETYIKIHKLINPHLMKNPVTQYYRSCEALAKTFVKTYYCEETPIEDIDYSWVGNDIGGILLVNNDWWSMENMVTALNYEIPEKTLLAWYNDSVDHAMENKGAEGFLQSFKDMFDLVEVQTGVSERERFVKEYEATRPINLLNYYKSTQKK